MSNEKNVIQNIILENRGKLSVSGVIDILTFDEEEITLDTHLGMLVIKGSELKVEKLSLDTGEITAKGTFDNISYQQDTSPKKEGFLKSIFR